MVKDGEGVPDRSERLESFALVPLLSKRLSRWRVEVEGVTKPVRMLVGPI